MTLPAPSHGASGDQVEALQAFDAFLASRDDRVFVLSGAAGTGKTWLLGQMMARVESLHRRAHLAALTGRAASVAKMQTGRQASTLHSFLYRFDPRSSKVVDGLPRLVFSLRDPADDPVSILFVDEASMLGSSAQGELVTMRFGSGNLAADLLAYRFAQQMSGSEAPKLVLIGDPYQLPPVGDEESVAFDPEGWAELTGTAVGYSLPTVRVSLTTVHRQGEGGVLDLATRYRDALIAGEYRTTPRPAPDDPEVTSHATAGGSLSPWAAEVAGDPPSQVVVTNTNAWALGWNRLVRQARWGDADLQVCAGDLIVNTRRDPRTRLDNGEILEVVSSASSVRVVAHLGREVRLRQISVRSTVSGEAHDALLDDNALNSDEGTMAREDSQVLWVDFSQRHRDLRQGTPEFWDAAYRDPILNPIVAKYGYALTGHKAQGGQWDRVIVDFARTPMAPDSEEAFRWTYTAITRARERLVLIDPPYRSPFSRLASKEPIMQLGSDIAENTPEQSPQARRSRAELAVETWANAHRFEIGSVARKNYNTRYEVAHDGRDALFDVYFNADGFVTQRLSVRAGADLVEDLMPPLALLERASFEGMPRPSDARIDVELGRIEEVLRLGGLTVLFRHATQWTVELQVGDEHDAGVLLLNFRKSGVFSARNWKRAPDGDVQRRVDEILDGLAHG